MRTVRTVRVFNAAARCARHHPAVHRVIRSTALMSALASVSVAQSASPGNRTDGGATSGANASAVIGTHDNVERAGSLRGGVLVVRLEVVGGSWRPEGASGPVREVYAFAEEGGAPTIPGPLLRVPEGTELQVTVRNRLAEPVKLHGLMSRPAVTDDFVEIAPGAVREFRFQAGAPGTYYYWARTTDEPFIERNGRDSQLTGAFIVDARGAASDSDRVFLLGEWQGPPTPPGTPRKLSLVVNGRSWPHTERLSLPFGLAVEWRVINATIAPHPMHLHGTFYTVESRGTALRDDIYGAAKRRLVTTELMVSGTTMMMRWVPDRVGNWLFHCHILAHVTGRMRLGDTGAESTAAHAEHDPLQAMAGLVLGIHVRPGDETAAPDLETHLRRRLTLRVHEVANHYGAFAAYGFALSSDSASRSSGVAPGMPLSPPIILTKGEPVVIGVANRIGYDLAIHWHGIELESFHDGVPGWSGQSGQIMPPVKPGETFDVYFTPPRAGTFIYHTHGHDSRQLVSGMYGPLIVLEPGTTYDPATDHVVLLGGSGPESPPVEVNRSTNPLPLEIKAGVKHRFRIINITANSTTVVSLRGDRGPAQWRAVAKDGADLPPDQSTVRPATLTISVGETYDFEFEPTGPGPLRLEVLVPRSGVITTQLIRVVP